MRLPALAILAAASAPQLLVHAGRPVPRDARVRRNVFESERAPKLTLRLDERFRYLGSFPFDIKGIAGGYRYLWGQADSGRHLTRLFIVQKEGFYADNSATYRYPTRSPAKVGQDEYQHNVWIYDNDQSAAEHPGSESDLTRRFLREHGWVWDPQSVMSRFARIVGEAKKDEIIFFYFEPLRAYTSRNASEFSDDGEPTPEQKEILDKVDANSKVAFRVED
jgi:hypothetical protein